MIQTASFTKFALIHTDCCHPVYIIAPVGVGLAPTLSRYRTFYNFFLDKQLYGCYHTAIQLLQN